MTDELKAKILRRDVLPRLQASRTLNQDRLADMMRVADATLKLFVRPGHGPASGWGFRRSDVDRLISDLEARPGFAAFDQGAFNEAPPMERLKRANRHASHQ